MSIDFHDDCDINRLQFNEDSRSMKTKLENVNIDPRY